MDNLNDGSVLVLLAAVVFFFGVAAEHFNAGSNAVRIAVGVSAVVLGLSSLVALL